MTQAVKARQEMLVGMRAGGNGAGEVKHDRFRSPAGLAGTLTEWAGGCYKKPMF